MKDWQKEKAPSSQMVLSGAGDEARTRYLDLGKVALYQMSYARKRKIDYTCVFRICQALICIFVFCSAPSALPAPLSSTSMMPAFPKSG